MTYFDIDELQLIVKRGKGEYDFDPEDRFYQISIVKRINALDVNEIVFFLDHHFTNNQFQFSFAAILHYYLINPKWIQDSNKRDSIEDWLEKVLPLNSNMTGIIFDKLFEVDQKKSFKERLTELLEKSEIKLRVRILDFCILLSEEGRKLHDCKF